MSIQGATGTVTKSYGRFSVMRAEITAFQKPIGSLEQHHNEKADFFSQGAFWSNYLENTQRKGKQNIYF